MHEKKAEMLRRLEETSRVHDAALERSVNVITNPGEFGWQRSILTAAVVVPLTGVSAVLTDLSRAILSHSDDSAWDYGSPPPPEIRDAAEIPESVEPAEPPDESPPEG